jgi:hypothetical protein
MYLPHGEGTMHAVTQTREISCFYLIAPSLQSLPDWPPPPSLCCSTSCSAMLRSAAPSQATERAAARWRAALLRSLRELLKQRPLDSAAAHWRLHRRSGLRAL